MLDVERMSESDVMNGKQVFSFIISMVIRVCHSAINIRRAVAGGGFRGFS